MVIFLLKSIIVSGLVILSGIIGGGIINNNTNTDSPNALPSPTQVILPSLTVISTPTSIPIPLPTDQVQYYPALEYNGYPCTDDCSGHEAGYEWAEEQGIDDPDDCGGNSQSFIEGCQSYAEEQYGQSESDYEDIEGDYWAEE